LSQGKIGSKLSNAGIFHAEHVELFDSKGRSFVVDYGDLARTLERYWGVAHSIPYVRSQFPEQVLLHVFLLDSPSTFIDHVNRQRWDNRRANLRLVTKTQNNMNKERNKTNKSGYKGVAYRPRMRKPYHAVIGHEYKQIHIGVFDSAEEAARAYDTKARELYGEYAYQNFP